MNKILYEDALSIISNEQIRWDKLRNKSVLITGANGMIGSYFMRVLTCLNKEKKMDIHIIAVVRDLNRLAPEFKEDVNVEIIQHDVTKPFDYSGKIDYLLHAASPASPLIMKEKPVETVAANALGTYYTLSLAKEKQVKKYAFVSSREIYGQPDPGQEFFKEDTYGFVNPLDPRSCYPEGKKVAETMCASFREEYGLNAVSIRLAHTYGPGMSVDDGRVQADFLKNVINDENIVLKSEGLPIRTYTYIADAIMAMYFILLNGDDSVYNVGDENAKTSIRDLAQLLIKIAPKKDLKLIFDIPQNGLKGTAPFTTGILNSGKVRKLGWQPKFTLESGFKRTIEYLLIEKNR